ncbi:hypothetical protein C5062_003107 [Escherichia coli]|nr:hypothetical protein [Escherichia coli]
MYPTDPRQLNTERQIYLDKQFFVDVFSIPACVRNTNGDFIGYNEKFSKEFIGSLDIKGRCEQVPDMRSSYSSGAHPRGTS